MGIQPQLCPWYLAAVGMEAIVWKSYFFLGFSPSPLVWEDRLSFSQSVQSLSSVWLFVTPWTEACQAFLPITNCPLSRWCHPTISSSVIPFSSCLQAFPASGPFRVSQFFASGSQSIGVSASTSVHWLDLLAVQGTLKSLLQQHSSKASILLRSAFFIVQLSHLYMTTGKTIALT